MAITLLACLPILLASLAVYVIIGNKLGKREWELYLRENKLQRTVQEAKELLGELKDKMED